MHSVPFAFAVAMVFCPCPNRASGVLGWGIQGILHHGLVHSMVFSESLEMARLRPLTQQSLDRGWCPSVRQGTVDLTAARGRAFDDFHRNLSALCDLQETSLLELLLTAPCLVDRLSTDFGYLPQFVWILGPLLERALLQVDPLRTPGSWWRLSALQTDTAVSQYDRAAFANAYVEASRIRFLTCPVLSVAVDDSRVGREPWKLGAVLDPATNFAAWLLPQANG